MHVSLMLFQQWKHLIKSREICTVTDNKTALILSAHAADFVWRCGGAIALHQKLGYKVTIACMSYGERGESAKLWKQSGMTLEKVKSNRKSEAEKAAKVLNRP